MGKYVIYAYRESICNGDDDQKVRSLEYDDNEMLSSFLKHQLSEYLPYTRGKTKQTSYRNGFNLKKTLFPTPFSPLIRYFFKSHILV